jgi:pimeloyl-ACP methyl ester carboxylesterase
MNPDAMKEEINYKYIDVDGIEIFYREAGNISRQPIIMLNGLPNASAVFHKLMANLKDDYYLVAPDFPGFGNSSVPDVMDYEYTFANISKTVYRFMEIIRLKRPDVYAAGYGIPITFRIANRIPDLFRNFIFQNFNNNEDGLAPIMANKKAFLGNLDEATAKMIQAMPGMSELKLLFIHGTRDLSKITPDHYDNSYDHLNCSAQKDTQLDLFDNYISNISEYPNWQKWLNSKEPRILVVQGKSEAFLAFASTWLTKSEIDKTAVDFQDINHVILDGCAEEIAEQLREFLGN